MSRVLAASSSQRLGACLVVLGCLVAGLAAAARNGDAARQDRSASPAGATVYIRLVGDLVITRPADAFGPERRVEAVNVELSTGSGVLISPIGHVLTAAHVVMPDAGGKTWKINGVPVAVKQTVRRLEVLLPPDESGAVPVAPLEATVQATDATLDLAVLTVSASNLPFLDLGDSDALGVGDPLEAVGFPFGDEVEIGKPAGGASVAPAPSVSRGNLAAVRGDDHEDRRYLQVTAGLNPGNSGGPIVEADGYLVGIANSVLRSRAGVGAGVGFGVPVNLVKRFLESNGLDSVLRARRLDPGALVPLEGKGLRVALPIGFTDASPQRTRVDSGPQLGGLAFRVDRVVSPWPLARMEAALLSARAFEPFVASTPAISQTVNAAGGRILVGRALGVMTAVDGGAEGGGTNARIDYAIAERGTEKVVARFIGPAYQLAYNASLIRSVLRQIEVDALRSPAARLQVPAAWTTGKGARGMPLAGESWPSGWLSEPVGPLACTGVAAPSDALSASPPGDFTVALRAGWTSFAGLTPQAAASACGAPDRDDGASYSREFSFLGTSYAVGGRFAAAASGLLQLEWAAPADQAAAARALFEAWVTRLTSSLQPPTGPALSECELSTAPPASRSR